MSGKESVILAIRVRGLPRVAPEIEDTLGKLKLGRVHQARVLKLTPSLRGMIMRAKDYITWGPISEATAVLLVSKRGRIPGNQSLSDEYVKKNSSYKSMEAFAKALASGAASISDIDGLKPVFRLTPPKKGFRGRIQVPVGMGGATGNRGQAINELAQRMI